jgi:acetyltransferase
MNKPTTPQADAAHDVLRYEHQPLDAIFAPKSVAVIGATEKTGSVGRTILWNLITNAFGGTIYPVNPKRPNVLGIKAYPDVTALPEPPDLVVVVTPAPTVPAIIHDAVEMGVRGAIIISAGFKETGPAGIELERQVLSEARRGRMRIIGPNCLGVMSPLTGLNATFAHAMARPGKVGFISQSGALCTAILDWSFRENVGFSHFVSIGSMLDVGWGDLIHYLGDDPRTESIVMYMETIGDARAFLSAAREVALTKPIIVIKPGRTEAAAKAAASHTGSLTGSDEVLRAAFRRCGVLRVDRISDLFNMAEVLGKQPRPRGKRLALVTNAGGPGVLATDALITDGGELAELAPATVESLNQILPPHWSHNNPVDILGDASPDRYAEALNVVVQDENSDGLLVILTPQAMTDPTETAERLRFYLKDTHGKPVLASWMGGAEVSNGRTILNQANIPTFDYPDTAAHMFNYMWRYSTNLTSLYETPVLPAGDEEETPERTHIEQMMAAIRQTGRTILTEYESKQVLAAYGIATVPTVLAASEDEAVAAADKIGYPVVVKLNSETITHKTDVGGVRLDLASADEVRHAFRMIESSVNRYVASNPTLHDPAHSPDPAGFPQPAGSSDTTSPNPQSPISNPQSPPSTLPTPPAFGGVTVQPMLKLSGGYEIILGSSPDPQFGPVLLFGAGGTLVEVFKDRALGLPPLNTTLARRMMEQTKIYEALQGVRGRPPVDLAALEQLMVNFSQLVVEQPWIREIDINPLLANPQYDPNESGLLALDARVVLYPPDVTQDQLPRLAIRPYPSQYIQPWTAANNTTLNIRPIRPEDEPLMVKFHESLSAQSVFMRYFANLDLSRRVAHERLTRICFIDFDREIVLVAVQRDPQTNERTIVGVGRLSRLYGTEEAEFAILISDTYQRQGLGTELLRRLLDIGRAEGIQRIIAYMLPENSGMKRVAQKLNFTFHHDQGVLKAAIDL